MPGSLPGGYKVGDKVFCTAVSQTFPSGDKVIYGQQGEVTGPATVETHKGKGVQVRFPGNKGLFEFYLTTVRRLRAASDAIPHPPSAALQTRDAAHAP